MGENLQQIAHVGSNSVFFSLQGVALYRLREASASSFFTIRKLSEIRKMPTGSLSLIEKRFYKFENVVPLDCKIFGTSNGWVLTERSSRQAPENKSVFLVNPISNAAINLPPVPPDHVVAGAEHVKKVLVVIGSESDIEAGVIILLGHMSQWSHYTSATIKCYAADRPWHHYRVTNYPHRLRYHDIVLYNRKLYSVVLTRGHTHVAAYTLDEQLKPHFAYQCAVEGTDTKSKNYSATSSISL